MEFIEWKKIIKLEFECNYKLQRQKLVMSTSNKRYKKHFQIGVDFNSKTQNKRKQTLLNQCQHSLKKLEVL